MAPIRLLTAVPVCDGHDSAINTVNLELIRHGFEVVYLGYDRRARDIVRAAIQEDVRAIGLSSYNGGHVEFFGEVVQRLREAGAGDVGVFGGGGGTITHADAEEMGRAGVDRIFFAGTPLGEMVAAVKELYSKAGTSSGEMSRDRWLAKLLSSAEVGEGPNTATTSNGSAQLVIGIAGPGGAGKTTLIDELVLRVLNDSPAARIAILSHDPSIIGSGALLGDRAAMIYSQNDRVFMRSLATRGQAGGLSSATENCLRVLKSTEKSAGGFDVIFVETVGIGQEAMPFHDGLVDKKVFVMSPDYGSRLQLQKIVMLDVADVVVVNKSDLAGAKTAANEVTQRLKLETSGRHVVSTIAKRHRDAGVDALFALLNTPAREGSRC